MFLLVFKTVAFLIRVVVQTYVAHVFVMLCAMLLETVALMLHKHAIYHMV